jgi:hypothetical protein
MFDAFFAEATTLWRRDKTYPGSHFAQKAASKGHVPNLQRRKVDRSKMMKAAPSATIVAVWSFAAVCEA